MLSNKKYINKVLSLALASVIPLSQSFCSATTSKDNVLKTEKKILSSKNKKIIGITSAGVVGIPAVCIGGFYILRSLFTKSTPQNNASDEDSEYNRKNSATKILEEYSFKDKFYIKIENTGINELNIMIICKSEDKKISSNELLEIVNNVKLTGRWINVTLENIEVIERGLNDNSFFEKYDEFRNKSNIVELSSNTLKEIKERAFRGFKFLRSIYAPNCDLIGEEAFYECSFLIDIFISPKANVKENAFCMTRGDTLFVLTLNNKLNDEAKTSIKEQCKRKIIFQHRVQNGSDWKFVID